MKKTSGLLRLVIILCLVMGGLSLILLTLSSIREKNETYITIDTDTVKLIQLDPPKKGDPIAIVDTTVGQFRMVLYPEQSPKAVENFIELAQSGYYDGTYVFNSDSGAYSAAGAPQKNGNLPQGYDQSRELIPRELSQDLWPFKGAVCVLNTTIDRTLKQKILGGGQYYNGSRFAVINTIEMTDEIKEGLRSGQETGNIVAEAFIQKGGIPNFAQQMTVIGQTYEGMDVVEALASLETENNGVYKVPKEDVKILAVTISAYSEED
ncbi:MAG: peptidylprolyl isomerase [Ruminococcus sp.]|nr:peptidylprolyl isomerase [Ruminococcus sp.]